MLVPVAVGSRRAWWLFAALSAALIAFSTDEARTQFASPVPFDEDEFEIADDDEDGPVAASSPRVVRSSSPSTSGATAGDGKARRLRMISGLTFDRRPSAILKTWQSPPPAESPAKAEPDKAPATKPAPKPADPKPASPKPPVAGKSPATSPSKTAGSQAAPAGSRPDLAAAKKAESAQKEEAAKKAAEAQK